MNRNICQVIQYLQSESDSAALFEPANHDVIIHYCIHVRFERDALKRSLKSSGKVAETYKKPGAPEEFIKWRGTFQFKKFQKFLFSAPHFYDCAPPPSEGAHAHPLSPLSVNKSSSEPSLFLYTNREGHCLDKLAYNYIVLDLVSMIFVQYN